MEDEGSREMTVSYGYVGSQGGSLWDDGIHSTIRRFVVHHKEWICSIQVEYDDNGNSIWPDKHGGNEGSKTEVVLDHPEEFLISVHGYYGDIHKYGIAATVIRSLSLESNRKTYGPFGIEDGTKFSFPNIWGKIVGFHGRCGWYLDAIGLHVQPIRKSEPGHFSLGEYGGKGGERWDEVFSRIRRFVVYHGNWIDSIQIEYDDKNGKTVCSAKHGGDGGSPYEVDLKYPDEYLISIHGYYDDIHKSGNADIVIRSLTLETNRSSYGPFGVEEGTKFSFPATGDQMKIVGIHGRSGWCLNSIGLHAVLIQK